jgi:hypothetical protein
MSERRRLGDLAINDNGFIFDPWAGATYSVNATGCCVLQALKEGLGRDVIAQRLVDRFEKPSQDPTRDVDEFVRLLRQYGLVPGDFSVEQ